MRVASIFALVLVLLSVAGCSSCTSQLPCTATSDCAGGEVCAATDDGTFCVPAGEEGEGEGEEGEGEGEPTAELRLESGVLEGDEALEVTLGWTLSAVSGCELQADSVDTGVDVVGQSSATQVIEQSQTLQIVCNEGESETLLFVVHDVSEIDGPAAATAGATVTLTFTVDGVTSCTVSSDGDETALSQPVITGNDGSFTDVADADKSYTLTCAGSEGLITREFALNVLTLDDVGMPAEIVDYGDGLEVTVSVESAATCALISTAADGSDRRSEGGATVEVVGLERTYSLQGLHEVRVYFVECSLDDASAESTPSLVRIRPRIVNFDARIPGIEDLNGAAATLELLVSVVGLEAGGACLINDGATDTSNVGSNVVLSTGPSVATYTLRCSAQGADPTPASAGGFQVLWRDATEADLALLAASRFAMRQVTIDNITASTIDLGALEQIGGDVRIETITAGGASVAVTAPTLKDVSGSLIIQDIAAVGAISLDLLRTADMLWIDSLGGLTSLQAPAFAMADEDFAAVWVWDCPNLQSISLPLYVGTGGFRIGGLPQLAQLQVPLLGEVNRFELNLVPLLEVFEAPSLRTIRAQLYLEDVEMETLAFPALETIGSGITLVGSATMRTFSLPVLTTTGTGSLYIASNDALMYLNTFLLLDTNPASNFTVTGNASLSCTEISDLYCPMLTRDITPTITNNQAASCPAVNSGC